MKSIYEQIMSQFNKQILVPFVAVIVVTLVALLLINEHQSHINKIALVTGTQENLVNLATSTSIQISDKFNHEKQSMELLQTLLKHNFKYPNKFKAKKNQFKSNLGLYSYKNKKFSLYTSNKKVLNQKALKYLGILVFTSPYIMKIVNISEYFISSARINIDFKYIFNYPKKTEMAQDINMIRYGPYNLADQKHNPAKKIIFIPLYDKPWAISLGEIGMIEAPIYLDNNMIGIARFTLHVKMLKKVLTNLRLLKGEFVAVLDNQNHVIISSNQKDIVEVLQAKSLYKLHLHHINLATNRANLRLLKKEYIFKIVNISDTSLRLLIASNKKTLFKNIDKLHSQTVYFTILTLIIILFLFVYMYIYAKKQIQKVADDISKPLKQIVHSSHLIGKSIDFTIQDSKIVELSALVTNLRSTHKQLFDMIVYDAKMRIFNKTKLIQDIKEIDTLMLFAVKNLSALQYLYGNMLIDDLLDKIVDEIKSLAGVTAYRVKEDVFALGMSGFDFNKLHLFYASLKLKKIKCGDIRFYVTLFAGIASTRDSENILGDAHLALMYARHNKISSPVTYQQARWLQGEFNKNIKWSSKLSDAFLQHRLEAYYQPVYDIKAGKIDKFEALVRLNEAGKVIPPLFFLEAAKNMGRIHDITIFMIKSVMQTASKHKNISFSINLSFKDFDDPEFLSFIKGTCEFYHVNPKNITFELLEADALDNLDISFNSINALKEMGFSIAIDDFGTGNSNFAHLMTMNVDYIKIDGQFIKDINQNAVSLHITHTIIQFSKLVGAKTVAEFVCNAEVLHSVKELGIDYAQGYEISKPVKASEIDVLLLKSN